MRHDPTRISAIRRLVRLQGGMIGLAALASAVIHPPICARAVAAPTCTVLAARYASDDSEDNAPTATVACSVAEERD